MALRNNFSRSIGRLLAKPLLLAALAMVSPVMPQAVRAQEPANKIESQYQNENDPVRKARLLAKLGPFEISQTRAYIEANNEEQALSAIEHYRDEVRQTANALAATKVDPVKHPNGFKDLQIGLRESIRRLNDIVLSLPVDKRPGFEAVRADLASMQSTLFEDLFPTAAEKSQNKETPQ